MRDTEIKNVRRGHMVGSRDRMRNIDHGIDRFAPNEVQRALHAMIRARRQPAGASMRRSAPPPGAFTLHELRKRMPRRYPIHAFGGHQRPLWLQDNVLFDGAVGEKFEFLPTGDWEVYDGGSPYDRASDWRDLDEQVKALTSRRYGLPAYRITTPHYGLSKRTQTPGEFVYCRGMARYAGDPGWRPLALQVCDGNYMSTNCVNSYVSRAPGRERGTPPRRGPRPRPRHSRTASATRTAKDSVSSTMRARRVAQ